MHFQNRTPAGCKQSKISGYESFDSFLLHLTLWSILWPSIMSTAVSNTSPLLAFSAIHRLELLQNVFEQLLIPDGVCAELFPTGTVWTEAEAAQRAIRHGAWIQ